MACQMQQFIMKNQKENIEQYKSTYNSCTKKKSIVIIKRRTKIDAKFMFKTG